MHTRRSLLLVLLLCGPVTAFDLHNSPQLNVRLDRLDRIGDLLTFDLSLRSGKQPIVGFNGSFSGQIHQQTAGDIPTPTLDSPFEGTTFATQIDSHFLFRDSEVISQDIRESIGPPDSSDLPPDAQGRDADLAETSFGQSMAGRFRVDQGRQEWDIAHLVLAPGGAVFNFEVELEGEDSHSEVVVAALATASFDGYFRCGDFDFDGDVDSSDYNRLKANWTGALMPGTASKSFSDGDCSGDGDIDTEDEIGLIHSWTGASSAQGHAIAAFSFPHFDVADGSEITLVDDTTAGMEMMASREIIFPDVAAAQIPDGQRLIQRMANAGSALSVTIPEPSALALLALGTWCLLRVGRCNAAAEN